MPSQTEEIAAYAGRISYRDLTPTVVQRLKNHLLDALGCAIRGLQAGPIEAMRRQIAELGGSPQATQIGGGKTALDRAAQFNTAAIRYLDFMDFYLAKNETCHPSDNIGSVLAACENGGRTGQDFLAAMAVAYHIQARMIDAESTMQEGFDHTTQLAYSLAVSVSKALGLDPLSTAHAIALAGSTFNPLVVARASYTYEWKGLLSSHVALGVTNAVLLAEKGITGPLEVFEGPRGYREVFKIKENDFVDWSKEGADRVLECDLKRYNAEAHTQPSLEGLEDLQREHGFTAGEVQEIEIETFAVAREIVGGGKYGPRDDVYSKSQADHSLPYLAAVLLLDAQVWPEQFALERIMRPDVQALLRRVHVKTRVPNAGGVKLADKVDPYTRAYPEKMMCKVTVKTERGKFEIEKSDYHGFHSRPLDWAQVVAKFHRLAEPMAPATLRQDVVDAVAGLENLQVAELMGLLAQTGA